LKDQEGKNLDDEERAEAYGKIKSFLQYIVRYANRYANHSDIIKKKLEVFNTNLKLDQQAFELIRNNTEKLTTKTNEEMEIFMQKLNMTEEQMNKVQKELDDAKNAVRDRVDQEKDIAITDGVFAGVDSIASMGKTFTGVAESFGTSKDNKHLKNSEIAFGVIGAVGKLASVGLTIAKSILAYQKLGDKLNTVEELEKKLNERLKLSAEFHDLTNQQAKFHMSTETQQIILKRLKALDEKVKAAIKEAGDVKKVWIDVGSNIKQLEDHAAVAIETGVNEDEKDFLFISLENLYEEWKVMREESIGDKLCNIFTCENTYLPSDLEQMTPSEAVQAQQELQQYEKDIEETEAILNRKFIPKP